MKMVSNRKIIILFLSVLFVIIVSLFFLLKGEDNEQVDEEQKSEKEVSSKKPSSIEDLPFDEILYDKIYTELRNDNKGLVIDGYSFGSNNYLVINQRRIHQYNDEFTGDILLWAKEEDGKVTYEQLGSVELVSLYKMNSSPFFTYKGEEYFVFYRKSSIEEPHNTKGYVYKIDDKGEISLFYETKGFYDSFEFKNGKMTIVEREIDDPHNRFPMFLKPYDRVFKEFKNGSWEVIKTERVTPKP